LGEWQSAVENLRRETTMDFFLYVCETSKIESWGSSKVYIRQFQQLYTCVTGRFMDRNDANEVYKVSSRPARSPAPGRSDTDRLLTRH
jgi:hypothetical protein